MGFSGMDSGEIAIKMAQYLLLLLKTTD
jgi:hypothetical protein